MKPALTALYLICGLACSSCNLVSDKTDYALFRDYYPGLRLHQFISAWNACQFYALDVRVFVPMMNAESGFSDNALSPSGARGVCQVMPFHAPEEDLYNTRLNTFVAARVLREYLNKARGDYALALVFYNQGPNRDPHKYGGWFTYVYKIINNAKEATI